jgi:hypothetical protein
MFIVTPERAGTMEPLSFGFFRESTLSTGRLKTIRESPTVTETGLLTTASALPGAPPVVATKL